MSGPLDFIARHRAEDIPHSGVRVVADEFARISRKVRMGKPGFQQTVWTTRVTQGTIGRYVNLSRVQVCHNVGILFDLKVLERTGFTYAFLDVVEHDDEIQLCTHPQCRAEVQGRRGRRRP